MSEWDRFDRQLAEAAGGLPPTDETVKAVTPWGRCMDQVVLGLILTSFTLHFLYLQYLLPAVGIVNLYLAFRTLRVNNRHFRLCWRLSGLRAALFLANLALAASPLAEQELLGRIFGCAAFSVTFLLYFFFRLGLRQAAADTGHRPASDPMLWALVWYVVLFVLAVFVPDVGWLGVVPMVAAFIAVVRLLTETTADIDAWGYQVRAAPVRVSTEVWRRAFYLSALGLVLAVCLVSNHVPVDAAPLEQAPASAETAVVRERLLDLGLPADCLAQLPAAEVEKLANSLLCDAADQYENDSAATFLARTYYFLQPDGSVRILHFFTVEAEGGGFWQSGCMAVPDAPAADASCRIFYEKDGTAYCADVLRGGTSTEEPYSAWFSFGPSSRHEVSATFSWPLGAQERHGWLAYTVDFPQSPETVLGSGLFYGQDGCFFHLPYRSVFDTDKAKNLWTSVYYGDSASHRYKADVEGGWTVETARNHP